MGLKHPLGCPRKLGSKVRKWLITSVYPICKYSIGCKPLILTIDPNFQGDIQAPYLSFENFREPLDFGCPKFETADFQPNFQSNEPEKGSQLNTLVLDPPSLKNM